MDNTLPGNIKKTQQTSILQMEVAPDRIHFLKFILEGYDGLAILSTLDARQGLVELRYPHETESELKKLLHIIGTQLVKNIA